MGDLTKDLQQIIALPKGERIVPLMTHGNQLLSSSANGSNRAAVVEAMLLLLNEGAGTGHQRRDLGILLGRLGDPRLREPRHDNYWVDVRLDHGLSIQVGRSLVSTAEFQQWIDAGGYDDSTNWSENQCFFT